LNCVGKVKEKGRKILFCSAHFVRFQASKKVNKISIYNFIILPPKAKEIL
jgi:hypothetical protein